MEKPMTSEKSLQKSLQKNLQKNLQNSLKKILLTLACVLCAGPALAWTPVLVCDGGAFEIDRQDDSRMYQIVLRGHVTEWFVNEAQLVVASRLNASGEIIQRFWSDEALTMNSVLALNDGKDDGVQVKIALKDAPGRFEARQLDPKTRVPGEAHGYNFSHCSGLSYQ